MIPPGPMGIITSFFCPCQGIHSSMCPSPRFLLSVERDSLFLAVRAHRQEESQDHPQQTIKVLLCCVPAVAHIWKQPALRALQLPQLLSQHCTPCPVNTRQARGLAARVKGHFISITFSSANENVSAACPREGFLQLQPSCD